MLVERLYDSERQRVGVAGSLMVVTYKQPPQYVDLEEVDRAQTALLEKFPKMSMMTVVGQLGAMRLEPALRDRSAELAKKWEKRVRGGSIVVTTRGLSAVMVRTFLSGLFLVSRSELQLRTHASIDEGLAWLRALPALDDSFTQLQAADVDAFIAT